MMASNWNNCGVCDYRQVTKPSVVWCSECDEGLCGDCKEHHSISKSSRNHETVSIAEYQKLPKEILQIATVCKIHSEKYELYCGKHDCPCCKKCVKSHNDCKGLTDINEIIKTVKTSNAFYEIEETVLEVAENIERIKTNRENNFTSLEKQRREIEEEIKQTRTKINRHLDGLQNDLLKELKAAEEKENNKIQKLLTDLKTKEIEITEFKDNIANFKQHASKLQAFLAIKHFETDISGAEKFIHSIIKSEATNRANISCQFTKSLAQITSSVQKFGEINVSSDPFNLSIKKRKQKQAQIMVTMPSNNINDMTLTLQKRINTELSNVHGCSLLPDGKMVFSCFGQHKIKVFKSDGSEDFVMNDIKRTLDVVYIGDNSIAVTSGGFKQINLIDTKNKKIKKTVNVNSCNSGAAYKDGHLIYCADEKGLQKISLNDESITNVINTKLSNFSYVTTLGDKLFYTHRDNNSVTCCNYHGTILWTFCDTSVLALPNGISVDNDCNVFVLGYKTNNMVVISPDGKHFRQLLSREDGLNGPKVLHYDTSTNKLLVANYNNTAFLYDVK
ncbi:putative autophagy-related protein 11 [Mytilus edulis]|uniref:putative autophagy-related protein 11 n=1 Tax=Mytilus edulis TaxID=6550 RepID=UPI0039F0AE5B